MFGQDLISLRSEKFKNQDMHTIKNTNSENYVAKKLNHPVQQVPKISHVSNIKATFFQLNSTL